MLWSLRHGMNTAQTITSAATTSMLVKFQTMTKVPSLRIVNNTIPLGLEADRTLQKLTLGDLLGPTILASHHDKFLSIIIDTTALSLLQHHQYIITLVFNFHTHNNYIAIVIMTNQLLYRILSLVSQGSTVLYQNMHDMPHFQSVGSKHKPSRAIDQT